MRLHALVRIDEYAASACAVERSARAAADERAGHLERRCAQLRAEAATLYEDFIRLEQDFASIAATKRALDARTADVARLLTLLAAHQSQVSSILASCSHF